MEIISRWIKPASILLTGLLLGVLGGWLAWGGKPAPIKPLRQSDLASTTQYQFIDPLIGLKTSDTSVAPAYQPLQASVQHFIDAQIAAGSLGAASVNFRDMSLSGGFVIDPDEKYTPASLFKVPTMMSYFKLAEKDPTILSRRLTYTGSSADATESYLSPVQLIPGNTYSIEELIEHMIEHSDNNAVEMLANYLDSVADVDAANNLVNDLGITQIEYGQDFITIRAYTLFFRVLYNATYLSRDMSEKALELLSKTDFTSGIVAGTGEGTPIAHKFGEFSILDTSGKVLKRELHDCGIVYYPNHPYLLCVMTKGNDFTKLQSVISGISNLVYTEIKNKYTE